MAYREVDRESSDTSVNKTSKMIKGHTDDWTNEAAAPVLALLLLALKFWAKKIPFLSNFPILPLLLLFYLPLEFSINHLWYKK